MAVARLQILGEVQGVGFRWFVRERARRLGLAGWVSNRDDGSVELVVSGDDDMIGMLKESVGRGPSGAVVTEVRVLPVDGARELPNPFTIVR